MLATSLFSQRQQASGLFQTHHLVVHAVCLDIQYLLCIALHLHLFIAESQKKGKLACDMQSQGLTPSWIRSWSCSQDVPKLPVPSQCI